MTGLIQLLRIALMSVDILFRYNYMKLPKATWDAAKSTNLNGILAAISLNKSDF